MIVSNIIVNKIITIFDVMTIQAIWYFVKCHDAVRKVDVHSCGDVRVHGDSVTLCNHREGDDI